MAAVPAVVADRGALARAWHLYYPPEEGVFSDADLRVMVIDMCLRYFVGAGAPLLRDVDLSSASVVRLSFDDLVENGPFNDFEDALRQVGRGVGGGLLDRVPRAGRS